MSVEGGSIAQAEESAMVLTNRIAGAAAIGVAVLIDLFAPPVQAGYVVDLTQQGSNVIASGSGAFDLTGLTYQGTNGGPKGLLNPSGGLIAVGSGEEDFYLVPTISGPGTFGSGGFTPPSSTTGDPVDMSDPFLGVPQGYVSDSNLAGTSTFLNQTFSSLGVTPGNYTWFWGTGANQDFMLHIPAPGTVIPEPSTWAMMLLGFAGLGFAGYRASRKAGLTA
jgi:PEP-CTERM motif